MSTNSVTIDQLNQSLRALGSVRFRKMFGEYAVYFGDLVVGFVCDDTLFIKITPAGKNFVGERYEEGEAYPGSKMYMMVPLDYFDESEWLCELIKITSSQLLSPKKLEKKFSL